jgi:LPS O-antigen subunit length determinant protein (WzzB/FepE family)
MDKKNEIDFFELAAFLNSAKLRILAGALAFTALAAVYAFLSKSVYESYAVISTRDVQGGGGGGSGLLSQLGGFGGAVASQFGLVNTTLDRMEIILKSREMAESVIDTHDLLPRLYPKAWDAQAKKWKGRGVPPNKRRAVEMLRAGFLNVVIDPRKKIIKVSIASPDSTLSTDLASYYLEALNARIQEDTRKDADGNRLYLEKQLWNTQDPLLRERIQNLMAVEIEKSMLVSSKAFDVLERPAVPLSRLKPKRRQIVTGAFVIGLVLSCLGVMGMKAYADRKTRA